MRSEDLTVGERPLPSNLDAKLIRFEALSPTSKVIQDDKASYLQRNWTNRHATVGGPSLFGIEFFRLPPASSMDALRPNEGIWLKITY